MQGATGFRPPTQFGRVNWLGLWSHYRRGLHRFLDFAWESLGGPCVFTLLILTVFVVAFGGEREMVAGLSYGEFIAPGLVMFSICYTAFESAAFCVLDDKLNRMIEDLLAAPLSANEIAAGYVLSSATCGVITGSVVGVVVSLFVPLPLLAPEVVVTFAVAGSLLFALVGTLVGLWADKWEHYAMADSFLVLPLGLLSGTFFTVAVLPALGQGLIAFNPVFYAIDGFRSGFIGWAETPAGFGIMLLVVLDLCFWLLIWRLFAVGYKVRP